jgi:hypothetical protein
MMTLTAGPLFVHAPLQLPQLSASIVFYLLVWLPNTLLGDDKPEKRHL